MFPIPFINRPLLWPKECQKQSQTLRIRLESLAQLSVVEAFEGEMILPMREILKSDRDWSNFLVTAELPRAMFGREKQLIDDLRRLQECGIKKLLIQNLGQILPAKEMGFCLSGGFGLNITNSYSLLFYREQGLTDLTVSFETNLEDIRRLKRLVPIGGIVYGKLPLMLTRSCPFWKYRQCSSCSKEGILTDRQGKQFSVRCHDGVREIYNPDLLYLADRKKELSCFDFLTLYFTDENAAEIATVVFEYQTGVGKREKLTRGLYYRKI